MSVVELGLCSHPEAWRQLRLWEDGRQLGELRRWLESNIWPSYGVGLWDEPWKEYFGNLSKSVQPYAHYSRQLLEWQFSVAAHSEGGRLIVGVGFPDPVKVSRISLFQALIGWTLGRLLLENGHIPEVGLGLKITAWGAELGSSDLLFKSKDWGDELLPTVFFLRDGTVH